MVGDLSEVSASHFSCCIPHIAAAYLALAYPNPTHLDQVLLMLS